jgi:hypothetical protein
MGRPKKEKDASRAKLMQVRLKENEFDEFKAAAELSGLELSSWVRERLLRAARKESRDGRGYR